MYFASPTYQIDGVTAGTSSIDCRRSHIEHMDFISQLGDESNTQCSTGGTTAPPPPPTGCTGCCTTASSSDAGKPCVFPFRFNGVLYNECTLDGNSPGETVPWCSTMTDSNDNHVGGQGKWGFCSSNCQTGPTSPPPTPTPTQPPTTPAPCVDLIEEKKCQKKCNNAKKCSKKKVCKRKCNKTCGKC